MYLRQINTHQRACELAKTLSMRQSSMRNFGWVARTETKPATLHDLAASIASGVRRVTQRQVIERPLANTRRRRRSGAARGSRAGGQWQPRDAATVVERAEIEAPSLRRPAAGQRQVRSSRPSIDAAPMRL